MTISIPRPKRCCSVCGIQRPTYSKLDEKKRDEWVRLDLCPSCFKEQKADIFWKRAEKEESKIDFSSLLGQLKDLSLSSDEVDRCTGLLLAEFLVRSKLVKRLSLELLLFRVKSTNEEIQFTGAAFSQEIRKTAQHKLLELLQL